MGQARAILWAQFKTLLNFYSRGNTGMLVFTTIMSLLWYGMVVTGSVFVAILLANPTRREMAERIAPAGLLMAFLYWQVVPIILTATGATLDMKRLVVYPIPHSHLFLLEVALRLTTGLEMIVVLLGATVGLALNPTIPFWTPLVFLPFITMNLCLSAGVRDLLGRLLARKRIRELLVFLLVLLLALPQVLLQGNTGRNLVRWVRYLDFQWWPWSVTARLAMGHPEWLDAPVLLVWTLLAYTFGRWQFERGFRFDPDVARAADASSSSSRAVSRADWLFRLPSALFPDPLGALIEKEFRFLTRAPRFRLVFLMGFSFGLIIWLPIAFRSGRSADTVMANNFLTFVTVYALMMLGEVTFWNSFGFDRSAAQLYFVTPVRLAAVLVAKNIVATVFVLLEITAVASVCMLLRMPVTLAKLAEAYSVTLVLTLFLMAVGNLGSVYYPRPVNPGQSWRSASGSRFQAMLLLVYPVVSLPIGLAYLARWAFDTQWAFYGVLTFAAALGAAVYWVAMDSAVSLAEERKEQLVAALAQGEGPVSA